MQAFGLYLILFAGLGLIVVPSFMLGLFGLNTTEDAWIRIVGMLASVIGFYYLVAAQIGEPNFFRFTIPARIYAACFMFVRNYPATRFAM
jgi:hypothetical protein